MNKMSHQLAVGLPLAGKTTFLAATWHVTSSAEVPGALTISEVHGIRDYLNTIRSQWLRCEEIERTKVSAERHVSLRLRNEVGESAELDIPDLSGETFKTQWETRQWTPEYLALAKQADGVLLFIHPRHMRHAHRIDRTADAMAEAVAGSGVAEGGSDVVEWSPELSSTQVVLVELLQFLATGAMRGRVVRMAVVISAWDLVQGCTPDQWLRRELPLLQQYLAASPQEWNVRVYGISAQGAELDKSADLQNLPLASERIRVVGEDCTEHDITSPLRWVMEL